MNVDVSPDTKTPVIIGRYTVHQEIACGGMATVHLGRLAGPGGFSRPVAIKRLHPHLARDPEFVAMFLDEARLAARIQHPNVVPTLDVVASKGEVFLVMEFIQGETLARLWKTACATGEPIDTRVVGSIMSNTLHGLHAAHEARNERGESLRIVHRDVSPQNIIVSSDGIARVLDFGVAKAMGRLQTTRQGSVKGKIAYMAPEQLEARDMDRRVDVFAAGVVCWELLAGKRMFAGDHEAVVLARVMSERPGPVSRHRPDIPPAIDGILDRALARNRDERFATARDFAVALEEALGIAPPSAVSAWVMAVAGTEIERLAAELLEIESSNSSVLDSDQVVRDVLRPSIPAESLAAALPAEETSPSPPLVPQRPGRSHLPLVGAGSLLLLLAALGAWTATRAPASTKTRSVSSSLAVANTWPVSASRASSDAATPVSTSRVPPTSTSRVPPRPTSQPDAACNPPYTLDPSGHKIWKRNCLR